MNPTSEIEKVAAAYRKDMPESVRTQTFKAAAYIYKQAGREDELMAKAFRKMASEDPGPIGNSLATAVHAALGGHIRGELEKKANIATGVARGAAGFLGGAGGTAADLAKMVLAGGLLTGGVGGAGLFAANRALSSEDDKLLKLEQERNIMKRLSGDIEKELKMRNLDPTPANTAAVVDYLT